MKRTLIILTLSILTLSAQAQQNNTEQPNITIKWAPTGLFLGSASFQAEYNFGGKNSLTAKVGLPVGVKRSLTYEDESSEFTMKATSFLAGYRTYLSNKHLQGLYFEPFFKYVHHASEGTALATIENRPATFILMNTYSGFGAGVQLGAQFFIGKRFVVDLFLLGPEINSASNSFKATEVGYNATWTPTEVAHVKGDAKEFFDQYLFIRNRMTILIDPDMKQLNATFKGALPGLRTGVSIGFAF